MRLIIISVSILLLACFNPIMALWQFICDLMAQGLARRAEDREVPGSSLTQD